MTSLLTVLCCVAKSDQVDKLSYLPFFSEQRFLDAATFKPFRSFFSWTTGVLHRWPLEQSLEVWLGVRLITVLSFSFSDPEDEQHSSGSMAFGPNKRYQKHVTMCGQMWQKQGKTSKNKDKCDSLKFHKSRIHLGHSVCCATSMQLYIAFTRITYN